VPTGDGEVTLGARDGLPGPAQRQQQRRLGRVGEGPAWVGAGGLVGTLAPDGRVPQQLGGPHRALHLRQPLSSRLSLHGPLGTLPCPAPPRPVLRGDGHIHGAGGGPQHGRPQPVHRPWRRPRGVRGDGGAGLRGLRQLLQLPVGHCKGATETWGDMTSWDGATGSSASPLRTGDMWGPIGPWGLQGCWRSHHIPYKGRVGSHRVIGTNGLLAIA